MSSLTSSRMTSCCEVATPTLIVRSCDKRGRGSVDRADACRNANCVGSVGGMGSVVGLASSCVLDLICGCCFEGGYLTVDCRCYVKGRVLCFGHVVCVRHGEVRGGRDLMPHMMGLGLGGSGGDDDGVRV